MRPRPVQSKCFLGIAAALVAGVVSAATLIAQDKRDISVVGRKYAYDVSDSSNGVIRVKQGDLVTITFSVADIAHSFTISDTNYRIDTKAEPGKPVSFNFRAAQVGEFEIRCSLSADARCQKEMRGRLIVSAK